MYTNNPNVRLKIFSIYFIHVIVNLVYKVYISSEMAKKTISFKAEENIRQALESEAFKKEWTLSYYIESILKQYAKRKKLV